MSDPTANLEPFIKKLLGSLDVSLASLSPAPTSPEQYLARFLPQLKESAPVLVNGTPIAGRGPFQAAWAKTPLTQHQMTSYDGHALPPSNQVMVVNCSAKVRFDEGGKNRMGETADLLLVVGTAGSTAPRASWGDWSGVSLTFVVDMARMTGEGTDSLESLDWRCTYKAENGVVEL